MVGDPTGKTDMRKMMTVDEINYNADQFLKQMSKFVDITPGKAIVAATGDWLMNLKYIELLRDVGVHFFGQQNADGGQRENPVRAGLHLPGI